MPDVLVARLRLTTDPTALAVASSLVDDDERARADRYRHATDRARHLLGRALARALLAARLGTPAPALRLVADRHGKPSVDAACAPSFNLSHSGGWIVCAIADDVEVGVDVQELVPSMARPDDFGPVFGPRERARIDAQPHDGAKVAAFARTWARKEALLKAVGLGLQPKLDAVDVVDGPQGPRWPVPDDPEAAAALAGDWTLRDVEVDGTHACAVAWGAAGGRTRVVDVDPLALGR